MGCAACIAYLPFTSASWYSGIAIGSTIVALFLVLQRWRGDAGPFAYLFNRRAGAVLFAVGIVLMSAVFYDDHRIFSLSFLILGFADPAAAFVGMSSKGSGFLRKSWPGFCAHCVVAGALLFGYFNLQYDWHGYQSLLMAIGIATGLSCIEALSTRGTDNITVPFASACGLTALTQFLN